MLIGAEIVWNIVLIGQGRRFFYKTQVVAHQRESCSGFSRYEVSEMKKMYAHGIQALSGGWTKQQRQVLTYDISCFLSVHKILQILNVQIVSSVPVQKIWSLCLLIT